jgi:hypothetical protein
MNLYISECFDATAMLMSESGQVVAMFNSIEEAMEECAEWIEVNAYYADHSEIYVD